MPLISPAISYAGWPLGPARNFSTARSSRGATPTVAIIPVGILMSIQFPQENW